MTAETAEPTNQRVHAAMKQTAAVSPRESRIPTNVYPGGTPFQRPRPALPSCRLAQVYGVAKEKTATALYTLSCRRVAQGNEVYLDAGRDDVVMAHMAEVDASMLPRPAVDLMTALHEAELADCWEQISDERFREKLRRGTATVEDAREYMRKSACARYKAEQAEQSVISWIAQQKAGTA